MNTTAQETLQRVSSTMPLDAPAKIVAFMKELLLYEQWVTAANTDNGLPPIEKIGHYLLHKPYVDPNIPLHLIKEFAWVLGLDNRRHAILHRFVKHW